MRGWLAIALVGGVIVSTATAAAPSPRTTKAPWPRPPDPLALARRAGFAPKTHEFFAYHVHAHLDVFLDGRKIRVPAGIVIEWVQDEEVLVRLATEVDGPALADIERRSPMVLGETNITIDRGEDYFAAARLMEDVGVAVAEVEGVPGAVHCAAAHNVCIGGKPYRGDPRAIALTNLKDIVITIGRPPKPIPSRFPQ